MKGEIAPAKALTEAKQSLVDYITALAYRFSLSHPITIALY
jgi:hypothetical protein